MTNETNNYSSRAERNAAETGLITSADAAVSKKGILNWIRTHKKTSAGIGIGAGVGVGLAGGNILYNVLRGPADNPTPVPTTSQTDGSTETATPSPTETEAPVVIPDKFDFNVDEQDIAEFRSEGQDPFIAREVDERVLLNLYFAEDMPEFAADWYSVTKNPNDELTALPSLDNTPQQIVTWNVYMHRMPETIKSTGDDYYLDIDAAYKMTAGNFVNPLSPSTVNAYNTYIDHINQQTNDGGAVDSARTLAVSGYFKMSVASNESSSELLEDENGYYRTIKVVEADSTAQNITYRWVVATNGVGTWVIESQESVQ